MLTAELIARAFYFAQINARGLDSPQSNHGKDGVFLINLLLSEQSVPPAYIPYYTDFSIDTVSGQEDYFVPRLAKIDAISFDMDTIRYGLQRQNVGQYKGSPRANNITSLPYSYWDRRVKGGMAISLYFLPNKVYQVNITGRFVPQKVNGNVQLDEFFDDFYQIYLIYALARKICQFYGISLPPDVGEQLREYEVSMKNINRIDTDCKIASPLSRQGVINYAQTNIGRGWVPVQ